jgi:hypothetical protein
LHSLRRHRLFAHYSYIRNSTFSRDEKRDKLLLLLLQLSSLMRRPEQRTRGALSIVPENGVFQPLSRSNKALLWSDKPSQYQKQI